MVLIRPAIYSGVQVFEISIHGVPVMRRVGDGYVNATQILRAAGLPKTQRTKVLEKEVCNGIHEKIQGGYHMFQGTWVPLDVAKRLSKKHGLAELLGPLFEYKLEEGSTAFEDLIAEKKAPKPPKPVVPKIVKSAVATPSWSSEAELDDEPDDDPEVVKPATVREPHPDRIREPRKPRGGGSRAGTPNPVSAPTTGYTTPAVGDGTPRGTPPPTSGPGTTGSDRITTRGKVYRRPEEMSGPKPTGVVKRSTGGRPPKQKGAGSRSRTASNSPAPFARESTPTATLVVPPSQAPNKPSSSTTATKLTTSAAPKRTRRISNFELDTRELMDPYGVLDPNSSSDDEYPAYTTTPFITNLHPPPTYFNATFHTSTGSDYPSSSSHRHDPKRRRLGWTTSGDESASGVGSENEDGGDPRLVGSHKHRSQSRRLRGIQDHCEGCGKITIPLWKKGPTGRRTLCDECGLKWCFGQSGPWDLVDSVVGVGVDVGGVVTDDGAGSGSGIVGLYDSDSDSVHEFRFDERVVPDTTIGGGEGVVVNGEGKPVGEGSSADDALNAQVTRLRRELEIENKNRRQLKKVLDAVRREDAGTDRAFRRAIVRARRAKGSGYVDSYARRKKSWYGGDAGYNGDGGFGDDETEDVSEDEDFNRNSVLAFINAVKSK
ncbi:transcriptional regulator swi6 [Blyttiomyces sp. JEL0837]|nr:transcriptional regulator swi6 [Blyttiomyces sp. JEL0837]